MALADIAAGRGREIDPPVSVPRALAPDAARAALGQALLARAVGPPLGGSGTVDVHPCRGPRLERLARSHVRARLARDRHHLERPALGVVSGLPRDEPVQPRIAGVL